MAKLTLAQVNKIEEYLDQQGLTFKPFRDEMTDHLLQDLEANMENGLSFDQAWSLIVSNIPDHQLTTVQKEVIETIDNHGMLTLSVNRNFYSLGVFFLGLATTIGLIQGLIFSQLGTGSYTLQSFLPWYVLVTIIHMLASLMLLKYYHYKKYQFTFSAGLVLVVASICHFIVVYNVLAVRELEGFLPATYLMVLGSGLIYGISLAFSKARKRYWLKTAGILISIFYLFLLATYVWSLNSQDVQIRGSIDVMHQWAGIVGSLIFLLFIKNFIEEMRKWEMENGYTTLPDFLKNFMIIVGVIALFFTIVVASDSSSAIAWRNRGPERAQELAQPFEAQTYVGDKSDTLSYRLLKPLNYDSEKNYPLVLSLHGGGGIGTDNVLQIEGSWTAQMLSKPKNREKYPAFVLVPQCPPGSTWGGIPDQPSVDSLVIEIIAELEKEFSIDGQRRYVMGESFGGYGTWHFICTRPKMFAAAVPICGGGDPNLAGKIVDVPVWAFHGRKDRSVPVRFSRDMVEAIKKAGGNPRYQEFPYQGHIISKTVTETPGLLDWVFAQRTEASLKNLGRPNAPITSDQ